MSIGTIVSDSAMSVQLLNGGRLGTVEESFISRLKPKDRFTFSGHLLEFIKAKDMTAIVKKTTRKDGLVPRWAGGRLPLTSELSRAIREELDCAAHGELRSPEMEALSPILEVQAKWSRIPEFDDFLVECVQSREGFHLFFFPFEGRLVHEGLAALFAFRLSREIPVTFSMASNDYGFELHSLTEVNLTEAMIQSALSSENLAEDITQSLNEVEMAKRQFREIARIAGLVFQGFPGMHKSARQVQASSGLFFDVFSRYDPENMLLRQAHREVLEKQLEKFRLATALERLRESRLVITQPPKPTPLAFPILVDRLRDSISTESVATQISRLVSELESAAG
jgi:ATP-dependent Lhr-like helicase